MKELKQKIRNAIQTGEVTVGSKLVIKVLLKGEVKLVIISEDCPIEVKERILYYSRLSEVPCYPTKGGSLDLGMACAKPFPVSALAIINEGESNILEVTKH